MLVHALFLQAIENTQIITVLYGPVWSYLVYYLDISRCLSGYPIGLSIPCPSIPTATYPALPWLFHPALSIPSYGYPMSLYGYVLWLPMFYPMVSHRLYGLSYPSVWYGLAIHRPYVRLSSYLFLSVSISIGMSRAITAETDTGRYILIGRDISGLLFLIERVLHHVANQSNGDRYRQLARQLTRQLANRCPRTKGHMTNDQDHNRRSRLWYRLPHATRFNSRWPAIRWHSHRLHRIERVSQAS